MHCLHGRDDSGYKIFNVKANNSHQLELLVEMTLYYWTRCDLTFSASSLQRKTSLIWRKNRW
jgi:hypothetical protein